MDKFETKILYIQNLHAQGVFSDLIESNLISQFKHRMVYKY